MTEDNLYEGREQTLVKHFILRRYLERFAHIIGYSWDSITYVDCFSGPWQSRSKDYSDTSFAIAIQQLRLARDHLRDRGKDLVIRCLFLEKNKKAYRQLENYAKQFQGDIEIQPVNAELEVSISDIVDFVKKSPASTFPFIFIDPTGWTGFSLDVIRPLLQLRPGEVLINFMTSHIHRFIDSPEKPTRESFQRLFGSGTFRQTLQGLEGQEREDAAVEEYMKQVSTAGGFPYPSMAMVLHPHISRSHFHLIYLTRHQKGIEVFKEAEKNAMKQMETTRAKSQQNRRVKKSKQPELFPDEEGEVSTHYVSLRQRYLGKARHAIWTHVAENQSVLYDDLWSAAMRVPMVWQDDLKDWIKEWKDSSQIKIDGLAPRERVPKLNKNHRIALIRNSIQ